MGRLLAASSLGLLLASPVGAAPQCQAGPASVVSIVVLASPAKVREYAATIRGAEVLRRDTETVVFAHGRVVTSDIRQVDRHLNALGWAGRRIQFVASFPRRSRVAPG